MNLEAITRHCCEKLSQQMRKVSEETGEKKAEQKEWQSKKEATRLRVNKLLSHPIDSKLNIREAQLNAQAIRTTTREIDDVIQRYQRENWRRDANHKQLLKEIGLERNKLIRVEVEKETIRQRVNKSTRTESRIPALITEFATKFSKLKNCLSKLKLIMSRYEMSLNDVISESSQAKLLGAELQSRFQLRQNQESFLNDQQRACAIADRAKSYEGRIDMEKSKKDTGMENFNDVDEEIVKERLLSERETNKQLDSLLVLARNWLLQEEYFKQEVEKLEMTNFIQPTI